MSRKPGSAIIIRIEDARAGRLRRLALLSRRGPALPIRTQDAPINSISFEGYEEPTERLLEFHPVFRYLA